MIGDGGYWLVRLDHRETFAIAYPIERQHELEISLRPVEGESRPSAAPETRAMTGVDAVPAEPEAVEADEEKQVEPAVTVARASPSKLVRPLHGLPSSA